MDKKKSNRTKSYTSIYDSYKSPDKYSNKMKSIENYLFQIGNLPFKSSDKYKSHKNKGDKNLEDSSSTIFYDLDTIAKRKSLNCISDITLTNKKVLTTKYCKHSPKVDLKTNYKMYPARTHSNGSISFDKPIPVCTHKIKKLFPRDSQVSSNFNVKTCDYKTRHKKDKNRNDLNYIKHIKYHVGSCSPVTDRRRKRNKDHSYASKKLGRQECFYSNKRSEEDINKHMEAAKDQVSDVSLLAQQQKFAKLKILKQDSAESPPERSGGTGTVTEKSITDDSFNSKYLTKNIMRRIKKHCQITCPNCNKPVLVATADEDKATDSKNSSGRYNSIELSKTLNYRYVPYNVSDRTNTAGCGHEPQCEMIPMCQVLHSVQSPVTSKGARKSGLRSPRILRVTKACRHHPPCTMVPSCQRLKVLKNNCQYFPECPHRPRCMNLPLCAPISKTTLEQFTVSVNGTDNGESQIGQFKYVPVNEQSTASNLVYAPCNYAYPTAPTYFVQPNTSPKSFSPYELLKPSTATGPMLNQSCQYDCASNETTQNGFKEDNSEGVIYIRDVGCQFRNKNRKENNKCYNSRDSKSSTTGDNESSQLTNDSLQSDEKVACLSPEVEVGSTDLSSIDETSHTTSNEQNGNSNHRRDIPSGFIPQGTTAQFIAYSTEPILANCLIEQRTTDGPFCETYASPARVMSRRSFLKQKYKKMFCVRRRRRSKINQTSYCGIRKLTHQNVMK